MSRPSRPPIIVHLRGPQSGGELALIEVLVEAGAPYAIAVFVHVVGALGLFAAMGVEWVCWPGDPATPAKVDR